LAVQYTLTQAASYASHGQNPVGSYIVTYLCFKNPESINNGECNRKGSLLYSVINTAILTKTS